MERIGRRRIISLGRVAPGAALATVVVLLVVVLVGCGSGSEAGVGVGVQEGQTVQVTDTVTVSGWAEVAAAPDEAVISVGVQNDAVDAAQALDQNSKSMAAVLGRLKAEGIQDGMIETANVSVMPNTTYNPQTGEQKVEGYRAQNTATVTLKDLSLVGKVFAAATEAGANNVNGPQWRLSESNEATKESLVKAVAVARAKAETLAAAVGLKLGDVVVISEAGTVAPPVMYESAKAAGDLAVAEPPVNPMKIQLSSNVTITYRLTK
jgi:uncharacterized protein YggE